MIRWPASSDGETVLVTSITAVAGLFAALFIGAFGVLALLSFVPPVTTIRAGVFQVGAATICLYVVSKLFELLTNRRVGYRDDGAASVPIRRVGDRALIGLSFAVASVAVIYVGWWHYRLAAREYAHSKLCYAELEAADRTPRLNANFAPTYLKHEAGLYLSVAEEHGAILAMRQQALHDDLIQAAAGYFNSPRSAAGSAQQSDRLLLSDVNRCIDDDWAPHGEILNP
jgi:hypothetical protein